ETRVMLLTSGNHPRDAARVRDLGIDAVLVKPVQREELLETIYRVMSRPSGGAAAPDTPAASDPEVAATPLRVLVAEGTDFNAPLPPQLPGRRGHTVRVASDARETLAELEHARFDLLLLDVQMPEMDGFEVVAAIREREHTTGEHLPVIAVTA